MPKPLSIAMIGYGFMGRDELTRWLGKRGCP